MPEPEKYVHGAKLDDRQPPEILWHYTTAGGLKGILSTKSLWATDTAFLNDRREYFHGLEVFHERLKCAIGALDRDERVRSRPALPHGLSFQDILSQFPETQQKWRDRYVFCVTCLCEDGDLLSQWRGYAGSGGYAIGFDADVLGEVLDIETFGLAPVVYDDSSNARIDRLIQTWLGEVNSNPSWVEEFGKSVTQLHTLASSAAFQLKDPAFKEEAEWRVGDLSVYTADSPVQFRDAALGLVPYTVVNLDRGDLFSSLIREITIGPTADYPLRAAAIRIFLASQGYDLSRVMISKSEIPFRT